MEARNKGPGTTATVIGAGMVGPPAARVLSEHADRVVVLERDRMPLEPDTRRGSADPAPPGPLHTDVSLVDPGVDRFRHWGGDPMTGARTVQDPVAGRAGRRGRHPGGRSC